MSKKTRQQRRARSRSPLQKRRHGSRMFLVFLLLVVVVGVGLIVLFRANPPPLTRGAIAGEHWHASLKIFICGKQVENFPNVEGELHSHADGFMHIHPSTPAASGDLASVSTFLRTYETTLVTDAKRKTTLSFPDGTSYTDGDRCPKSKKRYDIEMTNKGKPVEGDPGSFLPHNGDVVVIAFGPEGKKTMQNPYAKAKGIPDLPQPSGAPAPVPEENATPAPD